jgi:16S rRNA processing protein RimM
MSLLSAGRIGRPHGLDGSFHVTRPRAPLLALGGSVRVAGAVREIVRRSGTPGRPILRLGGIDDRPGAETVRGEELLVERADAPELPAGEYWAEDLEGCAVVTPDGRELGHVQQLRALPSCEVLEVGELLVPMVADAVLEISIAQRRIVVDPAFLGVTLEAEAEAAEAAPAGAALAESESEPEPESESEPGPEPERGPEPESEPEPEPAAERGPRAAAESSPAREPEPQSGRDGQGAGPDARRT